MIKYYNNVECKLLLVFMVQLFIVSLDVCCAPRVRRTEQIKRRDGRPSFALITQRTSGRLGDQLLMYVKQKWVCWKYGGKLLHLPFPQSSLFALHDKEEHYNAYYHNKEYKPCSGLVLTMQGINLDNSLYTLGFFFHDARMVRDCFRNTEFKNVLREALEPTIAVPLVPLSSDGITVALHVRKGEAFDGKLLSDQFFISPPYACADENFILPFPCPVAKHSLYIDEIWPLRFLPDQFYIDQLCILASMFPTDPIRVYLFTDAINPQDLAKKYQKELKDYTNMVITTPSVGGHEVLGSYTSAGVPISYRNDEEYNTQLLSELFCMARCNVLIRGLSGVSLLAEILGDHALVVTPAKYYWKDKKLITHTVIVRGANKKLVRSYSSELVAYG